MEIIGGWAQLAEYQKFHFFRADKVSLCGRWRIDTFHLEDLDTDNSESEEDCKICRHILNRLLKEENQ